MSPKDGCDDSSSIWRDLVEFVVGSGGHVHPSLRLDGAGVSRGLVASGPISVGDLLVRLPASCVISGENLRPVVDEEAARAASPWLLCLGAYLRAKRLLHQADDGDDSDGNGAARISWAPYFQSLPSTSAYETVLQWSLEEIKSYLRGTTLGRILEADRTGRCTEEQYRLRVEPFLEKLGLVDRAEDSVPAIGSNTPVAESPTYLSFLEASMCLATRGFHLTSHDENDDSSPRGRGTTHKGRTDAERGTYSGPFLLPAIDLLNHDPPNSCTTLQRDPATGSFWMVAERPLPAGAPVVHSYGDDLTSAQLLQTFGFVPLSHTREMCLPRRRQFEDAKESQDVGGDTIAMTGHHARMTPAYLRKLDDLLVACQRVKTSSYPKDVRDTMIQERQAMSHEEEEDGEADDYFWNVQDVPDRPLGDSMPEEFLVSASSIDNRSDSSHFVLSEEIITFLAVQFLPEDAYLDIFSGNDRCDGQTTLDRSILTTDQYLRKLVCQSIMVAIDQKLDQYAPYGSDSALAKPNDVDGLPIKFASVTSASRTQNRLDEVWKADQHRLEELLARPHGRSIHEEREVYGRTIRLEELTNLKILSEEAYELLTMKGDSISSASSKQNHPPCKRAKLDE
jgi:hypothetical protein